MRSYRKLPRQVDSSKVEFLPRAPARGNAPAARFPAHHAVGFANAHRNTKVRTPRTNGLVERMNRTLLDECFRVKGRENWYLTIDEIRRDLDAFMTHYNLERSHEGYRLNGRTPAQALKHALGIIELPSLRFETETSTDQEVTAGLCVRRVRRPDAFFFTITNSFLPDRSRSSFIPGVSTYSAVQIRGATSVLQDLRCVADSCGKSLALMEQPHYRLADAEPFHAAAIVRYGRCFKGAGLTLQGPSSSRAVGATSRSRSPI